MLSDRFSFTHLRLKFREAIRRDLGKEHASLETFIIIEKEDLGQLKRFYNKDIKVGEEVPFNDWRRFVYPSGLQQVPEFPKEYDTIKKLEIWYREQGKSYFNSLK